MACIWHFIQCSVQTYSLACFYFPQVYLNISSGPCSSTSDKRWLHSAKLQNRFAARIQWDCFVCIVADERNGSGPNSSCLPLHLISRSYGENLPAVNIWFSLAWTILCVGSATVWICGDFPGCLSCSTANFFTGFRILCSTLCVRKIT